MAWLCRSEQSCCTDAARLTSHFAHVPAAKLCMGLGTLLHRFCARCMEANCHCHAPTKLLSCFSLLLCLHSYCCAGHNTTHWNAASPSELNWTHKGLSGWCVTCLLGVIRSASPEAVQRADELKNLGNHAFFSRDLPKAVGYYSQALHLNPTSPMLHTNRYPSTNNPFTDPPQPLLNPSPIPPSTRCCLWCQLMTAAHTLFAVSWHEGLKTCCVSALAASQCVYTVTVLKLHQ